MKKSLIACLIVLIVPYLASAAFFESECPEPALNGKTATFETAFAPTDQLSELVVKHIKSAKNTIRVAAHTLASKNVSIALIDAIKTGKDVKIILERNDIKGAEFFIHMSVPPHIVDKLDGQYQDYIVIDDQILILGNISSIPEIDDEKKNSASVLVIANAGELAKRYAENWQKLWQGSKEMKKP